MISVGYLESRSIDLAVWSEMKKKTITAILQRSTLQRSVQWYHAHFWKYSKALMSQNPRYAKNQVTGAGHLQEFKNTELVWKLRKTGFYEGGRKYWAVCLRECVLGKLQLNTCIAQGKWQQHITESNTVLTGETLWSSIHLLALVWTGTSPKFSSTSPSLVNFEVSLDPGTLAIRWGNLPDWV